MSESKREAHDTLARAAEAIERITLAGDTPFVCVLPVNPRTIEQEGGYEALTHRLVKALHDALDSRADDNANVLLTAKEVATVLRLTPKRVRELVAAGTLEAVRIGPRGRLRFRSGDIDRLLAKGAP